MGGLFPLSSFCWGGQIIFQSLKWGAEFECRTSVFKCIFNFHAAMTFIKVFKSANITSKDICLCIFS